MLKSKFGDNPLAKVLLLYGDAFENTQYLRTEKLRSAYEVDFGNSSRFLLLTLKVLNIAGT